MFKRLRIYYLYTALPFILLLIGAVFYHEAILRTITNNPHPQINYLIFVITLLGGGLIMMNIGKLMQEAKKLSEFTDARRSGASDEDLQELAINYDADIAYVLRMIAASSGRSITHQEQIAMETELDKATTRINSRNALPQFFGGLLVGLGLLGTFIGLLATLDDIAVLIASFATLDMKTADPIAVFGVMVNRMEAPMHSMGIAFSASMYGLMGSIVLGFMNVSVRRCMSDIMSILASEVAQHIEFALARDGFAYSKTGRKLGMGKRPDESLLSRGLLVGELAPAPGGTTPPTVVVGGAAKPADAAAAANAPAAEAKPGEAFDLARTLSEIDAKTMSQEVRLLRRIEERIADSVRVQERSLNAEIDDFTKQRSDLLRIMAENTEASNNFRSELQRVGRQLGSMLMQMEKGNNEVVEQISELKIGVTDGAAHHAHLLGILVELIQALPQYALEQQQQTAQVESKPE